MSLREALRIIWAGKYLVVVAVVVVVAGALFYLQRQVPTFEAAADVQIISAESAAGQETTVITVDTDPSIVRSEPVMTAAAESLADGTSPAALAGAVEATYNPESLVMTIVATATTPDAAVARANAVAQAYIGYLPTVLDQRVETLQQRRDALREQLEDVEGRIEDDPDDPLAAAERDTIIDQYQAVSAQQSAYASIVAPAQILTPATSARSLDLPKSIVLAVAMLLGVVAGIGLAFAYVGLDVRLRTADEAERIAGANVLAELYDTVAAEREFHESGQAPVTTRHATPFTESIRELRTAVGVALGDRPSATVVVTAADPLAPRAFLAANLAASFALSGRKTILVAGDMRQPQFGELLNDGDVPEPDALGLLRTRVPNLRLLILTEEEMDPADYLASEEARALIGHARDRAPVVVVDAPPVLAAADATILGGYSDGVVLVAALRRTDRAVLHAAVERLRGNAVHVLGVALSGAKGNRRMLYASTYGAAPAEPTSEEAASEPLPPPKIDPEATTDLSEALAPLRGRGRRASQE